MLRQSPLIVGGSDLPGFFCPLEAVKTGLPEPGTCRKAQRGGLGEIGEGRADVVDCAGLDREVPVRLAKHLKRQLVVVLASDWCSRWADRLGVPSHVFCLLNRYEGIPLGGSKRSAPRDLSIGSIDPRISNSAISSPSRAIR